MIDVNSDVHREQMERLYNSKEYRVLETQLSVNNARFNELDPKIKLLATYLVHIGGEDVLEDLWRLFYLRKVPSFEEFLDSLGVTGKMTYPVWRNSLKEHFAPGSLSNELIFGGSIGSGKSFASRLAVIYNLIRVINLVSPQLTLGKTPESVLVTSLLTVTLDKAAIAVYKPYINMLERSSLFEEVKRQRDLRGYNGNGPIPYLETGEYTEFPNNIILNIGSQVTHAISYDLFSASLDEAESRSGSTEKALDLYSELKNRVKTRFLGSRFSLLCLISSSKSASGVISQYTSSIVQGDPATRIFSFPIWEVKESDPYKKGFFFAMRGTAQHPSRILTDEESDGYQKGTFLRPVGTEIYKVPMEYLREFRLSTEKALRDIAGVQSQGEDKLFDDLTTLSHDNLTPELRIDATLGDKRRLIDKLPSHVFSMIHGRKVFKRASSASRYVHCDLAEAGMSEAGVTFIHKEIGPKGDVVYVADLAVIFSSHIRIDLGMIKQFIIDVVEECGVLIEVLSADQYQSSALLQEFEQKKIARNVHRVSVDRTSEPYLTFSRLTADGRVKLGHCPILKNQLENLFYDKDKIYSHKRKDLADSIVGAVWNAHNNHKDFPVERFDEINKRQFGRHEILSEYFTKDHQIIPIL